MPTWKLASTVFVGGTAQIKALVGRRVRTRVPLHGMHEFEPEPAHRAPRQIDLPAAAQGLVANPHPTNGDLLIVFLHDPTQAPKNLASLRYGSFTTVRVNVPTFRLQFDVEMA